MLYTLPLSPSPVISLYIRFSPTFIQFTKLTLEMSLEVHSTPLTVFGQQYIIDIFSLFLLLRAGLSAIVSMGKRSLSEHYNFNIIKVRDINKISEPTGVFPFHSVTLMMALRK